MEVGAVVFGVFPVTGERTLTDHHSVVVKVSGDKALLVYTTSIKPGEAAPRRKFSREFTAAEKQSTLWSNRCRYDATQVAEVPLALLKVTGRVPSALARKMLEETFLAARAGVLQANSYNPAHEEKVTGHASRAKREAAFH